MASTILVEPRFGDRCLTGLAAFSHVEVVVFFDRLTERENHRQPLRPRGRACHRRQCCSPGGSSARRCPWRWPSGECFCSVP
ncbi:hypothetical protein [Micromonospora sp. NPDC002717]|uniref:hypothetical protein n=1 Tax=Micromonospora sp. NPDC002717 TaxID=3154424 RepID=UPI003318C696